MNKKYQNAIQGIAQDTPPIWFMRQAGRYHSHYQGLRKKYSFEQLCKQPELAAEVALGPIEEFDFDVSILFSDILFPLEALGMGLKYDPAPTLSFNLDTADIIKNLKSPDEAIDFMSFQGEAVKATRELLPKEKSLVGFVGGLWTLFAYGAEGSHKGGLKKAKALLPLYGLFLEKMYPLIEQNIQLQLDAGVEVVYMFDTAAGELPTAFFNKYIFPDIKKLSERFPGKLAYYTKNISDDYYTEDYYNLNLAGRGFDHKFDLCEKLKSRDTGIVQGNFDQTLLFADPENFKAIVEEYLRPFTQLTQEERTGWVCGLGHGVLPQTPEANVKTFIEIVRKTFNG